ncbi:MAG: SUMF1/EgtB/PvdO family nonheme iron enzyme, partial [Anaerolineales bacterium]|nr:SUMF1/EgtB/PvdO family nonheme iron enzyme [Anaerolineales bacterium]
DQWEVAARYDDGRLYPWGNDFDAAKANTGEGESVGQTTAVGIYPAGMQPTLKLYDLSGNVWEWCRNKYSNLAMETADESGDSRALRGG